MALDKVTVGVLADNAVTSSKIADGTVVAADIGADAVGTTELANDVAISTSGAIAGTGGLTIDGATVFNEASADVDFRIEGNGEANLFYVDAGNDRIGIGTASPAQPLHITSATPTILFTDTTNGELAYIGDAQDFLPTGATADSFGIRSVGDIRFGTGGNNTRMHIAADGKIGMGYTAGTPFPRGLVQVHGGTNTELFSISGGSPGYRWAWGYTDASATRAFQCNSYTNSSATMEFQFGVSMGSNTKMIIYGGGNIGAPSGSNIYSASDERLKQNVTNLTGCLGKINDMQGVSFNWIDGYVEEEKDKTIYGLIAQDLQVVDTNLVDGFSNTIKVNEDEDDEIVIENPLRVNEKFVIPMLVEAVKELSAKVTALENA